MSREYPCVYYDNQKCRKFEEPGYTSWCVMGPCSHETPSNADHLRAMSDEELADALMRFVKGLVETEGRVVTFEEGFREELLHQLQQPVKDGDTDGKSNDPE